MKVTRMPPIHAANLVENGGNTVYLPITRGISPQFPHKSQVNHSLDCFFTLSVNKQLNQQMSCGWFETPWRSCGVIVL